MPNQSLADLTTVQLRRAVAIKEQIEALESELSAILGGTRPLAVKRGRGRPKSRVVGRPAARAKTRRKMSAAARAKLRASAKARWAAAKAKGQTRL
jgi:hypothetical protein